MSYCSKGHEQSYLKKNPYKGLSVDCDTCDKVDIHPQGFMHCYKCDEDHCMKCVVAKQIKKRQPAEIDDGDKKLNEEVIENSQT